MKRIILLSLILLVAVSSIIACDKKPQPHKKLTPEQIRATDREIEEDIHREKAVLLSCKYNLEMQRVLNLLIDLDNDKLDSDKTLDITKYKLLSYSKKYRIKINVIAAIIIDHRLMSCPDCTCDCSRDSD